MSYSNDTARLVIKVGEQQNNMSDIMKDFLFKLNDQTELITETLGHFERQFEKMEAEINSLKDSLEQAEQELSDLRTENRKLRRMSLKELDNTIDLLFKRRRTLCPYDQDTTSPSRNDKQS